MMTEFSVRYIVDDVDAAADFYTRHLQFEVVMKPGPGFAMLRRNGLRLTAERRRAAAGARARRCRMAQRRNRAVGTDFN